MSGAVAGIVFSSIGISAGVACVIRGVYLAIKSSYTELNAIIWCWVGAGICQATTLISYILTS